MSKLNRGFSVQTKNGHVFDPKALKITGVDSDDIAHALSNICRYAGHCRRFYSVAEHSVLVSRIVRSLWPDDLEAIWAGLLHDATEAYVGDVTTPLKVLLPKYMEIEDALSMMIAKACDIKWTKRTTERVKTADLIALSTEVRGLFNNRTDWDSVKKFAPMENLLHPRFPNEPARAKIMFTAEVKRIQRERNK